jgi:hypothetical protein
MLQHTEYAIAEHPGTGTKNNKTTKSKRKIRLSKTKNQPKQLEIKIESGGNDDVDR